MASKKNETIYIGVTSNIIKRVWEHRNNIYEGFTNKYDVKNLVYYEWGHDINAAIKREKCLKRYKREWKIHMIEDTNPNWNDLYSEICK